MLLFWKYNGNKEATANKEATYFIGKMLSNLTKVVYLEETGPTSLENIV